MPDLRDEMKAPVEPLLPVEKKLIGWSFEPRARAPDRPGPHQPAFPAQVRARERDKEPAMTIDWTHFTPGSALAGGLLIGLAAAWLILDDGRILGASGMLGGLIPPRGGDWRVARPGARGPDRRAPRRALPRSHRARP